MTLPPKKTIFSLHQNASPYTFFPGCSKMPYHMCSYVLFAEGSPTIGPLLRPSPRSIWLTAYRVMQHQTFSSFIFWGENLGAHFSGEGFSACLWPWILWGLGPCCLSSALGHPNGKPVLPGRLDGETLQIQHENMNMDPFGISVTLMSCDSYMATKRRARSDMALLCKEGPIASTNTKSNWLFSTWNGRPGTWERKDANIEGDSNAQLARIAYSHAASYSVPPQAQVSFQPFIHERRSLPTFVFDSSQLSLAPTDPCIWIHLHVGTCASFGWPKTHNHKQLFIL